MMSKFGNLTSFARRHRYAVTAAGTTILAGAAMVMDTPEAAPLLSLLLIPTNTYGLVSEPTLTVNISRFDSVPNDQLIAPAPLWFSASVTGAVGFDGQPISEPEGDTNVYDPTANEVFWSWSFGEPGYVPLVTPNVPLTHRDTNRAFCKRPCHVFATPGNKTVTLYGYDSAGNWGTATYTFAADGDSPAIIDPDVFFAGNLTCYYSQDGVFPDPLPSGAVTATTAAEVATWMNARESGEDKARILFRRGETYGNDDYAIRGCNVVMFDAYDDPLGQSTALPKHVRTTSSGPFGAREGTDLIVVNQDWEGPYDAATETGRRLEPFGSIGQAVTRAIFHRVRISGARYILGSVGVDPVWTLSDTEITNWQDYGALLGGPRLAIVGCDIYQKVDALNGIEQGGASSAPTELGSRHGPIRGGSTDLYVACSSFFSRNGWSALSSTNWTTVPPTAAQAAFRVSTDATTARSHTAFDRCSFDGGSSGIVFGPLDNANTVDYQANMLVESCLFVASTQLATSFQPGGSGAPLVSCRSLGQSIRNSYFYAPETTYTSQLDLEYMIESTFVGAPDVAKPSVVAHFNNTGFIAAATVPGPAPVGFAFVSTDHDDIYLDNNVFYAPNLGTPIGTSFAPLGTSALTGFTPRYRGNRWNFRPVNWAADRTSILTVSQVRELGAGDVADGEWVAFDYPDYTGLCAGTSGSGPLGQVTEAICEANSTQYHQISVFDHPEKAMAPAAAGGTGSVVFDFTPTKIRVQNNSGATWSGASYVWVLLDLSDHLMDFDAATASPLTIPAPVPASGSAAILETASGLLAQRDFFGNVRQGKAAGGQAIVTGKPIVQGAMAEAP